MRRPFIPLFLVAGLLSGMLTAVPTANAKNVKLTMWTLFGSGAYYDRLKDGIEQYRKKHPNVKIELLVYGEINEKLKVATAGGIGPDLLVTNGGIVEAWNMQFMLKPLNSYIKQAKTQSKYLAAPLDHVTRGGKVYALPWAVDANFPVVYNRDVFAEVGLPDRMPKTPDETLEFNLKLHKKDPASKKVLRTGFIPWDWFGNTLGNWAWAYGEGSLGDGEHYTLTNPNIVKAMEYYVKTGNTLGGAKAIEDFIAPIRWSNFSIQKWTVRAMVVPMIEGLLKTDKKANIGVGPFPTTPQGVPSVWLGGQWLAMGSRCKHPQEAFDFLSWITTDMEIQKSNRNYWFCGVKAAYDQRIYEAGNRTDQYSRVLDFAADLVPQARAYKGGLLDGGDDINKAIQDAVIKQTVTVPQALAEANRRINKLIDDKITRTGGRIKK